MKSLPKPLQDKNVKDIFTECVMSFTSKSAQQSKLKYVADVESCSQNYDKHIPNDIENFFHPVLSPEAKKDLKKIYSEKFSKDNTVGKKYYDVIMAQANGVCPICRTGTPTTMDHYLPQSKYPLLVVTPVNLVPACKDCNMGKSSFDTKKSSMMPLHPYFDKVDDKWLEARIAFSEDATFSVEFYNGIESSEDSVNIKSRIDSHIKVHHLQETFKSKAITELGYIKGRYKEMSISTSVSEIKYDLEEACKSAEDYDANSWKAALYRALVRQVDEYIEWLKPNL